MHTQPGEAQSHNKQPIRRRQAHAITREQIQVLALLSPPNQRTFCFRIIHLISLFLSCELSFILHYLNGEISKYIYELWYIGIRFDIEAASVLDLFLINDIKHFSPLQ